VLTDLSVAAAVLEACQDILAEGGAIDARVLASITAGIRQCAGRPVMPSEAVAFESLVARLRAANDLPVEEPKQSSPLPPTPPQEEPEETEAPTKRPRGA